MNSREDFLNELQCSQFDIDHLVDVYNKHAGEKATTNQPATPTGSEQNATTNQHATHTGSEQKVTTNQPTTPTRHDGFHPTNHGRRATNTNQPTNPLSVQLREGFDQLSARFEKFDDKFNNRLNELSARFEKFDDTFNEVRKQLIDQTDEKVDEQKLDKKIDQVRRELSRQLREGIDQLRKEQEEQPLEPPSSIDSDHNEVMGSRQAPISINSDYSEVEGSKTAPESANTSRGGGGGRNCRNMQA